MSGAALDTGLLALRVVAGLTLAAHGYQKFFMGGKIKGTAGWFESLGMKPGIVHAWMASIVEVASGAMLVLGLGMPLAGAGVIGTMVVALVTNHRKNGFFIFRPGEGYEYVLFITMTAFGLAALGGGKVSLDNALDIGSWMYGGRGLLIALLGVVGAIGLLVVFWRPAKPTGE